MGRLPDIDETTLSAEQRAVYDQILRARPYARAVRCVVAQRRALRKHAQAPGDVCFTSKTRRTVARVDDSDFCAFGYRTVRLVYTRAPRAQVRYLTRDHPSHSRGAHARV